MPRLARQKSNTGIYHLMLRGTNKQQIFHDEQDYIKFLTTLERYRKEAGFTVYGWCLMGNHVHLLIKEGKEELSLTMKRIGVSFAKYYNWKYNASGHLFQDRYRSENIENEGYLISVIRYIHRNPVKAGMVQSPKDWRWSSCKDYFCNTNCSPLLVETDLVLGYFSETKEKAVKAFIDYNLMDNEDKYMDDDDVRHIARFTDEMAHDAIKKLIDGLEIANIKSLPKLQRTQIISRIKTIRGVTQRQISRILGLPLSLINRAE